MLMQRATCVNIYQYLKIGMNIIAVGKADFVQKQTPISGVWINVGAEGYVHKYIPIYEVGMNIIAVGKADFVQK